MARTLPLLLTLAWTAPLAADDSKRPADTPEDVAKRAMAALKAGRLDDFARDMHPAALKQFKAALGSIAENAAGGDQGDDFLKLFDGVKSVDELKKLDDAAFFVAFLRGVMRISPLFGQTLAGADMQIIGHVPEGKDTAHVVMRMTMTVEGAKVTKVDVISLRQTDAGWGMLMNADLENMASALKRQFDRGKK